MMKNNDILQQKIDYAIKTRNLAPIRLCEDMYKDPRDIDRIYDCIEAVHKKTREAQKRTDDIIKELEHWEAEQHENPDSGKNIIAFPFGDN